MKTLALIAVLALLLSGCWVYTNIQGSGTVTSLGTGNFNCTTGNTGDCEQAYRAAGSETLEAKASPGHTFAYWENCPYETIETCKTSWDQRLADLNIPWTATAVFNEKNPPIKSAQYTYNALGQRVTKTVGAQVTIFQYDLDGRLLAEIDGSTGHSLRQYLYVDGEPVAQLMTTPGTGDISVHYVHADHLGTPTLLTNRLGRVVADTEATPFGETYIDYAEIPHNSRFSGQYRDSETELHYNYFRYYYPNIGQYIQSDPIGLAGGLNTYGYVAANPINAVDPMGLYWFRQPWQIAGTVGRPGTPVPPGGVVSEIIERYVPAGYTFGEMHDDYVRQALNSGMPELLINIPSMPRMYVAAVGVELMRSFRILEQPESCAND